MMKVYVPDSCMGDVIGDLNKRRGRILGMNPTEGGEQEVVAEVPMAEVGSYAITLRSITQGRGWFTYKFERYEEAPPAVQDVYKRQAHRPAPIGRMIPSALPEGSIQMGPPWEPGSHGESMQALHDKFFGEREGMAR